MTEPRLCLEDGVTGASAMIAAGVTTCNRAEGLADIRKADRELVIWRRALPLCLRNWLATLEASRLPDIRLLVQPSDLPQALEPHLDDSGMAPGEMRDLLLADVGDLVSTFASISRSALVDMRLERVNHDACWKFHRDWVEARLLTTYRGLATEWVPPAHAEQALREQRDFEGPLERLKLHDVAIFKGSCAAPGSGIVHRSPPIKGTGQTRLLLCLNTPSDASPTPWLAPLRHGPFRT